MRYVSFSIFRRYRLLHLRHSFCLKRWGDAPVHTIGVGLLARKDQIHFFDEIGYEHDVNMHCPQDPEYRESMECSCDMAKNFGASNEPSVTCCTQQ